MSAPSPVELAQIYRDRFEKTKGYRARVWKTLIDHYFARYIPEAASVLDLGCGYGEFINQVRCHAKFAIDLNPDTGSHLAANVQLFEQDCSTAWPLADSTLDLVFTSNFLEHLPDTTALDRTLDEAFRCLRSGGQIIAMGPNITYLGKSYWDFPDHHLALTDLSLREHLTRRGFKVSEVHARFLPYTMQGSIRYPQALVRLYLRLPALWRVFGHQFLIVAAKP